jgi:hypothetical protein
MQLSRLFPFVLGMLLTLASAAQAAIIQSFTGDLRSDASFTSCGSACTLGPGNSDSDFAQWAGVERDFTIATFSSVQAVTFSYGGGTNGSGAAIAAGGFEPYLSLFNSSGAFLASTYFGVTCPSGANTNAGSGQCFDVLLDGGVLAPGTYAIVISAFANMSFAENSGTGTLGDGLTGLGNLAFGEDLHYAFDVSIQDASPVPEPKGAVLIGVGVLLLVTIRRKIREN